MIINIYKNEGIGGFYKGLLPSLLMTINPVIFYTLYEIMRNIVVSGTTDGNISSTSVFIITFIAKIVTTFVTYPMLTIKTLFQANETKSDNELLSIIKNIIKKEGFFGLYKGNYKFIIIFI